MSVTGHIIGNWNLSGDVGESGGTNVVPNPPEEATDSLEKVAIDDVVYSITGEQEQADWDQADPTAVDYIKNKPTIPAAQVNSDWDAASGVAQILNKPTLSTVATSGDYDDLINKPTIPAAQVNSDWDAASGVAQILNKPTLSTVAISGSYTDLTDKPTIPAAQVNSDWDAASGVAEILNKPTLSAVATSGEASDVSYDNTSSGMAATDVQEAVDELKSNLTDLNSSLNELSKWDKLANITTTPTSPTNMNMYVNDIEEYHTICIIRGWTASSTNYLATMYVPTLTFGTYPTAYFIITDAGFNSYVKATSKTQFQLHYSNIPSGAVCQTTIYGIKHGTINS